MSNDLYNWNLQEGAPFGEDSTLEDLADEVGSWLISENVHFKPAPAQAREEESRPESWEIADEIYNLVDDIRETETDPRYPNAPECERPVLSSRQSMERIEAYCRKREAALRSRQSPQAVDRTRRCSICGAVITRRGYCAHSAACVDAAEIDPMCEDAAPQHSPQGEDADWQDNEVPSLEWKRYHEVLSKIRAELGSGSDIDILYRCGYWPAVKMHTAALKRNDELRARLASAQSSAQGEEAREMREANKVVPQTLIDYCINLAVSYKEGEIELDEAQDFIRGAIKEIL